LDLYFYSVAARIAAPRFENGALPSNTYRPIRSVRAERLHLYEYITTFAKTDRFLNRIGRRVESICGGFAKAGVI
jgi:hypothetical protein